MKLYRIFRKCFPVLFLISVVVITFSTFINSSLILDFTIQPQYISTGMIRQYSNDNLNSRVDVKLPKGIWEIKWQSPLIKGLDPQFILAKDERILVQGFQNWQLFDVTGKNISIARFNNSDVIIDPDKSLIYCADQNSMLTAYGLSDGKLNFILDDVYGVKYRRSFITRFQNKLFVVSNEQQLDPHSSEKPDVTYIQIQIMENQVKVDDLKILNNSKRSKIEKRTSAEVIAASTEDQLIITYKDNVELLDQELNISKSYQDKFIPLAISLDEKLNIYLIVQKEDGKPVLWILNSECKRIFEYSLPVSERYEPPCIGYDGTCFVNLGNQILAINPKEELIWNKFTQLVSGMLALSDYNLLLTEGAFILAFDNMGERKFVFEFPTGTKLTPPCIDDKGEIYIADAKSLYCLKIKE